MHFYLRQNSDTDALFIIMDSTGQLVYRVTGDSLSIGNKISMIDNEQNEIARISSVGLATLSKYTIYVGEKERAHLTWNSGAKHHQVKIKGKSWRFRGELVTRSFDIVNVDSSVVMTHGRCWNNMGDCYGVDIKEEVDIPVCLCLAVILDSIVLGGTIAAVPAN